MQENRIEDISSNGFPQFECICENEKKYRLKFDGGSTGFYFVDYCQQCADQDNKLYLVSMEEIK